METLTLTRKSKLLSAEVYCEWHPANEGLVDIVYHANTLPLQGSVSETLDAYEPTARAAIVECLSGAFPGMYD